MAQPLRLDRPGLFIVTGAGRGFGRALTLALAARAVAGSRFILLGRNQEALAKVSKEVLATARAPVETHPVTLDLARADSSAISAAFTGPMSAIQPLPSNSFGLLVHNAGTLGDFGRLSDSLQDKAFIDEHWATNMTSVLLLNAFWLRLPLASWHLVNVSSLCAVKPFKTMAVYCASKAARLMFFRTLALERPDLTILSYGPGPLDTDMQAQLRSSQDESMRSMWQELQPRLLPAEKSALVLLRLLQRGGYSGDAQVDVFEVMDELLAADDGVQ